MPERTFSEFLNKMSGMHYEQPKSESKPKNRKKKVIKEEEVEDTMPQKSEKPKKTEKNDDVVVKALDYATKFVKVIYDNFTDPNERETVLRSVKNAIELALNERPYSQSSTPFPSPPPSQPAPKTQSETKKETTNEQVELHMNDLTGQPVSIQPQQSEGYDRKLNLGLKVGTNGKQEVDLSSISQKDINEMKMLAGVGEHKEE